MIEYDIYVIINADSVINEKSYNNSYIYICLKEKNDVIITQFN